MSSIQGIYHGKRPVLEIRKGNIPLWKSNGWTTPNTNIGLAYSVKVNTYYRGMALPDGRMVYGFLANPANVIESDLSISTLKLPEPMYSGAIDPQQRLAVIRNDLASSYFASPSDITQKIGGSDVPYNALAVSETGEFMAFSTYYRRVDYFKTAASSQRNIIFGSNAFGISYYHNFFYVLYSQGVNGIKLNKYDIDGNLVATKDDSQTFITVGDHGNVSNSTQMTYDAAGNIFVVITYATDTPRLYKITTNLQVFQYKLPNISSVVDADILMDKLGNLFLIRYSGSLNSNGVNNLEISKFKNDLTLEWSTLVKGAAVTNVSMDLRGNIYVKNGSMVDVYQQIQA